MDAKKIPVVKVGRSGATGTPEDFENHFDRKRRINRPSVPVRQPKLKPIETRNLNDLLSDHNLGER